MSRVSYTVSSTESIKLSILGKRKFDEIYGSREMNGPWGELGCCQGSILRIYHLMSSSAPSLDIASRIFSASTELDSIIG